MISWFSFLTAMTFYSAALAVILLLRGRTGFLKKHGVSGLLLLSALALVRMLLPLDFAFSRIIESWTLLPAVQDFFRVCPWLWFFLLAAWGIGTAVVLAKDIFSLLRAYKVCQEYTIVESESVQQIAENLSVNCPVLVSPDVSVPYVAGLFQHTIYLPLQEMSSEHIYLILLHEMQHIRSHDSQIKLLFGLFSAVFWWNPIIYKFRGELDALLELRCDAKVTEHMDIEDRAAYISMLLDMMKQMADPKPVQAWSAVMRSSSFLRQRVMVLLDHLDAKPRPLSIAVICCLIAAFLASYMVIWQPAGAPPIEEEVGLILKIDVDPDTFRTICKKCIIKINGQYYLFEDGWPVKELSYNEAVQQNLYIMEGYYS